METKHTVDNDLIITLTKKLLVAIDDGDWKTYATLCDEKLSCFEPESPVLVEGLPFHKFYFDLKKEKKHVSHVCTPFVRLLGKNSALIAYTRVVQKINSTTGAPETSKYDETRIWEKTESSEWKMVHFHRSK